MRGTFVIDCSTDEAGYTVVRCAAIEVVDPLVAFPPLRDAPQYRPGLHAHPFEAATDALAEAMPEEDDAPA